MPLYVLWFSIQTCYFMFIILILRVNESMSQSLAGYSDGPVEVHDTEIYLFHYTDAKLSPACGKFDDY